MRRPTASDVFATMALFSALGGTALAAKHFLITNTNQIKPSVLAQLKGAAGHNGAAGSPGAPGSPGAQGPIGLQGPIGPAGPSKLSALTIVFGESKSVPKETVSSSTATCPAGSHAVSGGGYNGAAALADSEMSPEHQSWFIVVDNETNISTHLEAVVYCAGAGDAVVARVTRDAHKRAVARANTVAARLEEERTALRALRAGR